MCRSRYVSGDFACHIRKKTLPLLFRSRILCRHPIALRKTQPVHTLASMSSVAVATDAPEEFAALADDAVDDFMSEAASDVEVFATTEGHRDVCAEEILTRDAQAHDRVVSRVARLPRRVLRCLLGAAGFEAPVWQTRIRRATSASLAEEVAQWYRSGSAPMRIVEAALATHAAQVPALNSLWAAVLESEDLLPHVLGVLDVHRIAVPVTCRLWRSIWARLPVTLLRLVGRQPACRTWRDEWPGAFQELHIHRRGHAASRAAYLGTGRYSIDAWLLPNFHRLLVQLTQGGWERDDAVLVVAVFTVMRMPLAWALHDVIGPLRCAATAYAVADVLARRARTLWSSDATAVAPAYKLLSALLRDDPAWAALTAPGAAAGLSFVVRGVIETTYGGKYGVRVSYEEFDLVCFVSACAGTDGGLRTLVPAAGACLLPPLARITLVGVKTKWRIHLPVSMASDAGTRPVTLKRCFVVHVAY